jgi:enoyl-CoA hydratase/3-hydroxyacyl-CoA dehydrogenase
MRLVEVIRCKYTSDETTKTTFELVQKLGKEPILVNKDIRGFIANRVYRTIRYEAFAMLLRGEAKPMEIDSAFRYKLEIPMGPFELADFTGSIEIELGEDKYFKDTREKCPDWEPHEEYIKLREYAMKISREYYEKSLLGVKTGKGFYDYPKPGQWAKVEIPKEAGEGIDPIQVLAPAINLSAWLINNDVASAKDIDASLKLGYNFPKGLLEMADEYGLDVVVKVLKDKMERAKTEEYGAFYKTNPLLSKLVEGGKIGKKTSEGFYKYREREEMGLEFKRIIYEKKDGSAWITLNNPERYNALDYEMRKELKTALADAAKDESVRAIVLKGSGRAFCAGADIRAFLELKPLDAMKWLKDVGTSLVLTKIIRDAPKPVIAAVHGFCFGGGFELAMGCDIIITSEDAVFASAEINVGLIPGGGGTQRLPKLIGEKKAKELIFTGDRLSAKEMAELGLVNKVVPPDKLIDAVNELVEKIKSKSPVMIATAKESVNASLEMNLTEGLKYEAQLFTQLFSTEDQKEGARAFLEKRKPEWKGK